MASVSIAKELLSLVSPYNYTDKISCLDTDNFVPIYKFSEYNLGKLFNIDRQNCLHNGEINNDHLYKVFRHFSDENAESVHTDVVECIETGRAVYTTVGAEFFSCRECSFQDWALAICSQFYQGDELSSSHSAVSSIVMLLWFAGIGTGAPLTLRMICQ